MKRCVVIGGAPIRDYDELHRYLRPDDFYVLCDSGLKHRCALGVMPSLIVGDFDSHEIPALPTEIIQLPREKDDTDTVYGVKEAVRRGYDDFLLLGMTGERLDHTLGNVSILLYLDGLGKKGMLVDDHSEMEIVSENPCYIEETYPYFSLLNISGIARGITVENAKFPVTDGEITPQYQYGISNEVLPGKRAKVTLQQGKLLLIKVKNPK